MRNKSHSNLQQVLIRFVVLFSLPFAAMLLSTCKQNPVSQSVDGGAGVSGIVYDTSGHQLDSVRIYCVYTFSNTVPAVDTKTHIYRISKVDTFGFNLFQNFPNPVKNSTYLRFSLPTPCSVSISLTDRVSSEVKYSYSESLLEGMYQLYLNNLVDSLQLHNGPYIYRLGAKSTSGPQYAASKEMFVVSDAGSPDVITKTDGAYLFDYDNAFVGDSVIINTNDVYPPYATVLSRNVTLLFERRGYYSLHSSTYLNPNIQIHSDIIMTRMGQQ